MTKVIVEHLQILKEEHGSAMSLHFWMFEGPGSLPREMVFS